jgi:hypothetical protein
MNPESAQKQMLDELESFLESMPTSWLLDGEPFVKYRTLIDLLEKQPTDEEVAGTKSLISRHRLIKQILDRQKADGYWGTPRGIYTWWPKKDTTF